MALSMMRLNLTAQNMTGFRAIMLKRRIYPRSLVRRRITAGFFCDMWRPGFVIEENIKDSDEPAGLSSFEGSRGRKCRGVTQVYNVKDAGIGDVTLKFYADGRHEMLNEINREEVFSDVIAWLDQKR